ncbi:MAG: phospholipase D family protein [Rhodoferax sp.]
MLQTRTVNLPRPHFLREWSGPTRRWGQRAFVAGLVASLAACGSLPQRPLVRESSTAIPASSTTALGRIAAQFPENQGLSGVRALPQSAFSLDTRLELIKRAQVSLDLQYYLLGNDETGRLFLRRLRDAAQRGVRVRLLLDDLYTASLDPLLLGLATYPNVKIRLFNPFTFAHGNPLFRYLNFVTDFKRLNHRMHNKLMIADGAMAVVGGRNLADEYFLRNSRANFVDFDVLLTGPVVPKLSSSFDAYWNSAEVYPLRTIVPTVDTSQELRKEFDIAVRPALAPAPAALPDDDAYGLPPLGVEIEENKFHFIRAWADAYADPPSKADPTRTVADAPELLIRKFVEAVSEAHSEVQLTSPYFIPGQRGMEDLRELRSRHVKIQILTNSLDSSDEPVVDSSYRRYRIPMLRMGIQLYELSPHEIKRSKFKLLRTAFGSSRGQLHAKVAIIDRKTVLVGSMNLDQRSAYLNTELGVMIHSPELARQILTVFNFDSLEGIGGVYRVELTPDGKALQWVGTGEDEGKVMKKEPGDGLSMRLRLWFYQHFVPESLL